VLEILRATTPDGTAVWGCLTGSAQRGLLLVWGGTLKEKRKQQGEKFKAARSMRPLTFLPYDAPKSYFFELPRDFFTLTPLCKLLSHLSQK